MIVLTRKSTSWDFRCFSATIQYTCPVGHVVSISFLFYFIYCWDK